MSRLARVLLLSTLRAALAAGSAGAQAGLRVRGNRLVAGGGRVVQLRGVNRSGLEYACIQG